MVINERPSDYDLLVKIRKGDLKSFDHIFHKYGDRLFGFALSYLKSKEETEGLVQDVFLKLWENRKNLKKESSLKSYLFTIAYHDMCQIFRKRKIHEKFLEERGATIVSTINMEEQLQYKVTLEHVDRLIDSLPEKQRIIFIKSRKDGKSTKEIAKEMNLAPGTIDNHISAALKFLRKNLSGTSFANLLFFATFLQ